MSNIVAHGDAVSEELQWASSVEERCYIFNGLEHGDIFFSLQWLFQRNTSDIQYKSIYLQVVKHNWNTLDFYLTTKKDVIS